MHKNLMPLLVCPLCKGQLEYHRKSSELLCYRDSIAFPVRNGVPVLLEMDARKIEQNKPG